MINWNNLVRAHSAAVFGAAWRILGHAQDAEDVVQEVFAEAHRLSNGMEVDCWAALLRKMAICRALDTLRRRRSLMPLDCTLVAADKDLPESIAGSHELEERLRAALKKLPAREAEVFCLRYFEDLSHHEIAKTLDISPTAASSALYQARARLETLLAEPKNEVEHERK